MTQDTQHEKRYLKTRGLICPFCGSRALQAGEHQHDTDVCYQSVECTTCKRTWTDEYTLTAVTFDPEVKL